VRARQGQECGRVFQALYGDGPSPPAPSPSDEGEGGLPPAKPLRQRCSALPLGEGEGSLALAKLLRW